MNMYMYTCVCVYVCMHVRVCVFPSHFTAQVAASLKQLHEDGYRVVVFSNQNGASAKAKTGAAKLQVMQQRMADAVGSLGIPVTVLAAVEKDLHRKV